jgi:hypothetical protein
LEFKRTPRTIDVKPEVLQSYVGEYELMGVTARFYLKEDKAVLYLLVPAQPEYELLPIEKHVFAIRNLDGYKVKFTEADGKITEVTFIQPNGTFVARRK